jgi:hypothetical protein
MKKLIKNLLRMIPPFGGQSFDKVASNTPEPAAFHVQAITSAIDQENFNGYRQGENSFLEKIEEDVDR